MSGALPFFSTLYELSNTKNMCATCCAFVIYSDICRIIDIPDGFFKIQDGGLVPGRVSCRYQFHMNPYSRIVYDTNFGSPVVNIF